MTIKIFKVSLPQLLIHVLFAFFSVFCILPMLIVVSTSFSDEMDIVRNGYKLIPTKLNTLAYSYILMNPKQLLNAYFVTTTITVIGTVLGLLLISMLAYAISRSDYKYKNVTSFYVFFTMLFHGGLVPWYILITKYLHLNDTIFVLFIPYLISPWFVLLMKGFLSNISLAIIESATIDGAGELLIFYKIILPLSKPALATVGLFMVLMYWNDWWLSLLFIERQELVSLQYLLYRIMSNIEALKSGVNDNLSLDSIDIPSLSARMAMCILAAGPMLFVFAFFQKYFVKGLTVGSVKG